MNSILRQTASLEICDEVDAEAIGLKKLSFHDDFFYINSMAQEIQSHIFVNIYI